MWQEINNEVPDFSHFNEFDAKMINKSYQIFYNSCRNNYRDEDEIETIVVKQQEKNEVKTRRSFAAARSRQPISKKITA